MIPFPFNENRFSFFFVAAHLLVGQLMYKSQERQKPSIMSESDTMFNERDRRCAAVQLVRSTDPSYDNRTIATILKMHIWIATNNRDVPRVMKQSFRLRLWPLVWFLVRATSCHLTSSKSAWKSTLKCTWMCWRGWWSPGAIRWPVVDPGRGSRTQRRQRFIFKILVKCFYVIY